MRWTLHGERAIYESEWVRLTLADVELPSGPRFEHHVVRLPQGAAGVVVADVPAGMVVAGNPARVIKKVEELTCPPGFYERPYVWDPYVTPKD